jgi:glucosamine--fructose-6-phosphate aminotransferase (isomerizing)
MHQTAQIAQELVGLNSILYVGRGTNYPVALEGALKLKELSYIYAHAYAAGELKHGPIALIDESTYVVAIAPNDEWFFKTLSNLQEIHARGGRLIIITDAALTCFQSMMDHSNHVHVISIPKVSGHLYPIICTIVIQLLAYNVAILKGCNVDQPRNLAKSVTVE